MAMFGAPLSNALTAAPRSGVPGNGLDPNDPRNQLALLQSLSRQPQPGADVATVGSDPSRLAPLGQSQGGAAPPPQMMRGPMSDDGQSPLQAMAPVPGSPVAPGMGPDQWAGDDQAPPMPMRSLVAMGATPPVPGAPASPKKGHGFFAKDGAWKPVLAAVGDSLLAWSAGLGNQGAAMQLQNNFATRRAAQQREQDLADRAAMWAHQEQVYGRTRADDLADAEAKAKLPQFFESGRDRVAYDPVSGQSKVVYDGPSDAQDYANSLGLEPGTPDYMSAMKDFVLKGNGPSALTGRQDLEGVRQSNRVALRGVPTYAATHPRPSGSSRGGAGMFGSRPPRTIGNVIAPILDKLAKGSPLSAGEQSVYDNYNRRRGGGGGGGATGRSGSGKVYTNAQGVRITWNGKTWVPAP